MGSSGNNFVTQVPALISSFFAIVTAVSGIDGHAIGMMMDRGHRTVEELGTTRLTRQPDPGFNRQFAA